jgi:hypothetical protein
MPATLRASRALYSLVRSRRLRAPAMPSLQLRHLRDDAGHEVLPGDLAAQCLPQQPVCT